LHENHPLDAKLADQRPAVRAGKFPLRSTPPSWRCVIVCATLFLLVTGFGQGLTEADLRRLLRLPSPERVARLSILSALIYMIALDLARPWRVARLRRRALGFADTLLTLGGFLRTNHPALERTIDTAQQEAALAKRILFLSRSQQVFHLWHVIHRPFSYTFALLALVHIAVVMMMGYL
jgi:hypothetical protein